MTNREVGAMPLKTFWLFSKSIDRLQAELDLRQLQVVAAAASVDAFGRLQERLQKQVGTVVKFTDAYLAATAHEEKLDRAGLEDLKSMTKAR